MKQFSTCKILVMFIFIKVMLVNSFLLLAQENNTDIARIGTYMNTPLTYSAELEYVYYPTYSSEVYEEKIKGKYVRKKNNVYLQMGTTESITTDHYYFSIDHEEKTIDILNRIKAVGKLKRLNTFDFDTLLTLKNEIRYTSKSAEIGICEIESSFIEYEKVQFYYNKKTFELYKIVLFYPLQSREEFVTTKGINEIIEKEDTAPRIEILYKNTKQDEEVPDALFMYDKYLVQKGMDYYCKPEYKNYTIN